MKLFDSCFFGHSWSKWEFTYNGYDKLKIPHQKRICKKCGEIQIKQINTF